MAANSSTRLGVSAELAEAYSQSIESFVDMGDAACIEIKYFKVPNSGDHQLEKVLRLLICPLNCDAYPTHPFPLGTYESMEKVLKLEKSYLFSERLQAPTLSFQVPVGNGLTGFVVKPEKWNDDVTDFSLSAVFNPASKNSNCILRILQKKDLKAFKARLFELKQLIWYPLYLPVILLEMRIHSLPQQLHQIRLFVYRLEKTTGTHKNYLRVLGFTKSKGRTSKEIWRDPAFLLAPGELTSIASECLQIENSCQTSKRLLGWLQDFHRQLMMHVLKDAEACQILDNKIEFMSAWVADVESRSAYLGKRAEVQVQTCHSLMAQRDNVLNQDTNKYTQMDSKDMRTIAAVTLGFLPATFMATLFSTSFFDFHTQDQVLSSWIWIYWLLTAFLTVVVYFGWYFYSRRTRRKQKPSSSGPQRYSFCGMFNV
ncbi:hypothetical protein DM02DRAFT_695519 [Periconia macrospinosa]|uniref:Uncharacterized protein n=1 Tax=Periconia macrospinosa TaxID=97972 RepID=A0A2V1DZR6_9PLEO|nr:hypothetical protein DM02DRAFT_695519 [Periconia macrospinosa]